MSEILSQDQIDALLNSQGLNEDAGNDTKTDPERLHAALLKTFDIFCEQAGTVISTVINKKVAFQTVQCEQASPSAVQEKLPSVLLAIIIPFNSEVKGEVTVLIEKTNVAVLSDLMMMGDGTAEYSEDHKDAIGELFNQVMGAFATALSSQWGSVVSSGHVKVTEFDIDNPPLALDAHEMILLSQATEGKKGETFLALLIPHEISASIMEKTKPEPFNEAGQAVDSIGLNTAELDDLSKVTSFENGGPGDSHMDSVDFKAPQQNIDMLLDIDLDVSIELGKSVLSIKRILELSPGSIIELDRMAGEPVDLLVNNKVVAKGEVVVVDENFGIRIVSLVSPEERIRSLR